MSATASAAQRARQAIRERRTRIAATQAEQDTRITDAVTALLATQADVAASEAALTSAQEAHIRLVQESTVTAGRALTRLKAEGLSEAEIVELTGLTTTEVRRAVKAAAPQASPSDSSNDRPVSESPAA